MYAFLRHFYLFWPSVSTFLFWCNRSISFLILLNSLYVEPFLWFLHIKHLPSYHFLSISSLSYLCYDQCHFLILTVFQQWYIYFSFYSSVFSYPLHFVHFTISIPSNTVAKECAPLLYTIILWWWEHRVTSLHFRHNRKTSVYVNLLYQKYSSAWPVLCIFSSECDA